MFLIMYLWNAASRCESGNCAHAAGGPALQVVPMPSIAACEAVGSSAKQMIDALRPAPVPAAGGNRRFERSDWIAMESPPTAFRCVEVSQ